MWIDARSGADGETGSPRSDYQCNEGEPGRARESWREVARESAQCARALAQIESRLAGPGGRRDKRAYGGLVRGGNGG
jgi:hypothetical protein